MRREQKQGFSIVKIIIIIVAVAVLGGFFGYQYLKLQNMQEGAKAPAAEPPVTPPTQTQPQPAEIDTSNWKTYRNEQYGFEVRYPGNRNVNKDVSIDPNTRIQREFSIEFVDLSGKRVTFTIYPIKDAANLEDWLNKFSILASSTFDSPPAWAINFSANSESEKFAQFDAGGKSAVRVWAKKGIYIFDIGGPFTDQGLQILSTFKFIPLEK